MLNAELTTTLTVEQVNRLNIHDLSTANLPVLEQVCAYQRWLRSAVWDCKIDYLAFATKPPYRPPSQLSPELARKLLIILTYSAMKPYTDGLPRTLGAPPR